MSTISIGRTTAALRQMLARRTEFCLTPDQDAVLDLLMEQGYFQVHPSTVAQTFGWNVHRASRVLDEVAETFDLTPVLIRSPWKEFEGWQWGTWIESGSWPVVAWWNTETEEWIDGPPAASPASKLLNGMATSPITVPVPDPVPATPSAPKPTGIEAAARRALEGTRISKLDAAKGLISYGVKELGMGAEAVADALIELSANGSGATRASLAQYVGQGTPAESVPVPAEDLEVEFARAERAGNLAVLAEQHPELAVGVAAVRELNEARKFYPVTLDEIQDWDADIRGNIRNPQPEEVAVAVREAMVDYTGPVSVSYVGRIMRRHREEADVEARRKAAMLVGSH